MNKDVSNEASLTEDELRKKLVQNHLELVLKWPDFVSSPQLAAFLRYIVACKLSGRTDQIKAYTIATEALGRPADFDPQNDPIVRVQARRLRQTLLLYYADPSADDAIRINLSAGSYVPEIVFSAPKKIDVETRLDAALQIEDKAKNSRPTLTTLAAVAAMAVAALAVTWSLWPAALPFSHWRSAQVSDSEVNPFNVPEIKVSVVSQERMPSWFSPELFKAGLERSLARFDDFIVVAPKDMAVETKDAFRIELEFAGFTFGVEGTARLVTGERNEIAWSYRFRVPSDAIGNYEYLEPLQSLTSKLAQPYGVLYSQLTAQPRKSADLTCILRGYEFFQHPLFSEIDPIKDCLEAIIKKSPGNVLAHTLLSYMYVEHYRSGPEDTAEASLDRALMLARRAVTLRPESSSGHQVLMEVLATKGYLEESLQSGRRAVELNSNDTDLLADYGCRLILLGRYSEGQTYAERAARLNQARPPWHDFCLFVAFNNTGRLKEADAIARRLEKAEGVQPKIALAITAARSGNNVARDATFSVLRSKELGFFDNPHKTLKDLGMSDAVSEKLLEGLTEAGFLVAAPADL